MATRDKLFFKRQQVYEAIVHGKVVDRLREKENRVDSPYNNALQNGPDISFDDPISDARGNRYLPAYMRYDGRFFTHAGMEAFETAILQDCHTLIVSGLYGLITLEEPIQAYNCHLDDELVSPDSGTGALRISDWWKQEALFDAILKEYIEAHNRVHKQKSGHQIRYVVDLLSEASYQAVFSWEEILAPWFKKRGIQRLHRLVSTVEEPGFLADLGRYYREDIVGTEGTCRPPPLQEKIRKEYFTQIRGSEYLFFKNQVELNPFVQGLLGRELGDTWRRLDLKVKDELTMGEIYFRLYDEKSSKDPREPVPRIMNYCSALEILTGGTLGNLLYGNYDEDRNHIRERIERSEIFSDIELVRKIRNKLGHKEGATRADLLKLRQIVVGREGILTRLVKLLNT